MDEWAASVLGEVDGDELVLVGASMGGYCALRMAAQAPDRVRAILLAGSRADADWRSGGRVARRRSRRSLAMARRGSGSRCAPSSSPRTRIRRSSSARGRSRSSNRRRSSRRPSGRSAISPTRPRCPLGSSASSSATATRSWTSPTAASSTRGGSSSPTAATCRCSSSRSPSSRPPGSRGAVDVTTEELAVRLDDPRLVVLDVRTPQEFEGVAGYPCDPRQGHIPGALHLEVTELLGLDDGALHEGSVTPAPRGRVLPLRLPLGDGRRPPPGGGLRRRRTTAARGTSGARIRGSSRALVPRP